MASMPPYVPSAVSSQTTKPNPRLYLDEWIREDIISYASNKKNTKLMQAFPLRQLIYYVAARRMAATLKHAVQHSLHYSRKFEKTPGRAGVEEAIAELNKAAELCLKKSSEQSYGMIELHFSNALSTLPFTWPDELAKEPESFLAVSQDKVEGLISQISSGTTASANKTHKRIFCTQNDLDKTIGFFASGIRNLINPAQGDKIALLLSAGGRRRGNLADLFADAMHLIGVPCLVPPYEADEYSILAELAKFEPNSIVASPRQIISLFRSRTCRQHPNTQKYIDKIKQSLRNVLITGDSMHSSVNKILSNELEADIFLHYGMVETGLGTAVECLYRNGCHYREADFFIEIITDDGVSHPVPLPSRSTVYIDPDNWGNGSIFGPTPWGEVTITSLSREGTPLIRYRTGDSGRLIIDKCACGSELWRLEVRGRIEDSIIMPPLKGDEHRKPVQIFRNMFDQTIYAIPWVKDYHVQVEIDSDGLTKALGINLLANSEAPASDEEAVAAAHKAMRVLINRINPYGTPILTKILRTKTEFNYLFGNNLKHLFTKNQEPLNHALYFACTDEA